jgi:hypothetical protein
MFLLSHVDSWFGFRRLVFVLCWLLRFDEVYIIDPVIAQEA